MARKCGCSLLRTAWFHQRGVLACDGVEDCDYHFYPKRDAPSALLTPRGKEKLLNQLLNCNFTPGRGSSQCLSVIVTITVRPIMRYSPLNISCEKRPDPSSPTSVTPFSLAALLASSRVGLAEVSILNVLAMLVSRQIYVFVTFITVIKFCPSRSRKGSPLQAGGGHLKSRTLSKLEATYAVCRASSTHSVEYRLKAPLCGVHGASLG